KKATECSVYIQEKHGTYETEIGIKIRVTIGLGAGEVYQCSFGSTTSAQSAEYCHYVCFGPGVKAASESEKRCVPGDVIMSPSAWNLCDPNHFNHTMKEDGYKKIMDILVFAKPEVWYRGRPMKSAKSITKG